MARRSRRRTGAMRKRQIRMLPIDAAMRSRFYANAPAALARRGGDYFFEQALGLAEFLVVPSIALTGLLLLDWSPAAMLLFILVTFAVGFAGDLLKYLLARERVRAEAATMSEDIEVWALTGALKAGEDKVQADYVAPYLPAAGLLIDFILGGGATLMMLVVLRSHQVDLWAPFVEDVSMRYALFGTVALQVLSLAWQLLAHTVGRLRQVPLRFAAGARGIGLFVLLFLVMAAGDEGRALKLPLVIANAGLFLLAGLGVLGFALARQETAWLREHLGEQAHPLR